MPRNPFADRLRQTTSRSSRCEGVQNLLTGYLDHELDTSQRSLVEDHLAQCPACRAELAAFQRAETALGSAGASIPSPGDLRPAFYARLEQSRRRPAPIRLEFAIPALACAGMALLLLSRLPGDKGHPVAISQSTPQPPIVRVIPNPAHRGSDGESGLRTGTITTRRTEATTLARARETSGENRARAHAARPIVSAADVRRSERRGLARADRPAAVRRLLVWPRARSGGGEVTVARGELGALASRATVLDEAEASGNRSYASVAARPEDFERAGKVVLAGLGAETELHVSDENRDFMASTHIEAPASLRDKPASAHLDDDNDSTQEAVELPALP